MLVPDFALLSAGVQQTGAVEMSVGAGNGEGFYLVLADASGHHQCTQLQLRERERGGALLQLRSALIDVSRCDVQGLSCGQSQQSTITAADVVDTVYR